MHPLPKSPDRLTITLGEDQRRRVSEIARQHRTSVATVIRWAVDQYLLGDAAYEGPMSSMKKVAERGAAKK